MPGSGKVPAFDGRGLPFLDFEQQVLLWMRATKAEVASRSSLSVLHLQSAPRQVLLAAGGDYLGSRDGVARILGVIRNYAAPDGADAVRRQVARSMNSRCAERPIDEFIVEFDCLRRKAVPKIEMGVGFPEQFISILRVNNAGLRRRGQSMAMASFHKSLKSDEAAANTRRPFGSRARMG